MADDPPGKDPEDLNLSAMVRRSTRRSQRSSAVVADLKIAELQGQQRPAIRSSSSGSINGTAPANSVGSVSDDEGNESDEAASESEDDDGSDWEEQGSKVPTYKPKKKTQKKAVHQPIKFDKGIEKSE